MIEQLPYEFKRTEKYMWKEDEITVSLDFPFTMLIDKLNELIGDYEHLKEVVLCRQLEKNKSNTASNQSNTELPKKIKLLREFVSYPAGDYELSDVPVKLDWDIYYYKCLASKERQGLHPDIIKATSWQGIRSEVTDGEATVNFMQYADEPAPDMRDVKTTVAWPPCKACYWKKQHTQLHWYRARGEEYGMKVHMNDCKRCNATGIEPTTESVSRTIDNSKILTKEKAQVHELMKELKEKEVEPTTGSVSTVEQETVWAWLLEWKKRKEEYISKLTTPDPYEECAKEITREFYELSICDWNKKMAEDYVSCILKKHFPPLSLT